MLKLIKFQIYEWRSLQENESSDQSSASEANKTIKLIKQPIQVHEFDNCLQKNLFDKNSSNINDTSVAIIA